MNRPEAVPIPVAVLGATGSVGQRFVELLARHPANILDRAEGPAPEQDARVPCLKDQLPNRRLCFSAR